MVDSASNSAEQMLYGTLPYSHLSPDLLMLLVSLHQAMSSQRT
jgi:hypothetical protein